MKKPATKQSKPEEEATWLANSHTGVTKKLFHSINFAAGHARDEAFKELKFSEATLLKALKAASVTKGGLCTRNTLTKQCLAILVKRKKHREEAPGCWQRLTKPEKNLFVQLLEHVTAIYGAKPTKAAGTPLVRQLEKTVAKCTETIEKRDRTIETLAAELVTAKATAEKKIELAERQIAELTAWKLAKETEAMEQQAALKQKMKKAGDLEHGIEHALISMLPVIEDEPTSHPMVDAYEISIIDPNANGWTALDGIDDQDVEEAQAILVSAPVHLSLSPALNAQIMHPLDESMAELRLEESCSIVGGFLALDGTLKPAKKPSWKSMPSKHAVHTRHNVKHGFSPSDRKVALDMIDLANQAGGWPSQL